MRMLMRTYRSGWSRAQPVLAVLVAGCVLAAPAAGGEPVRVHLAMALPNSGRVGSLVQVSGRVLGAPAGSRVALERWSTDGRWDVLALTPIAKGRFALSWAPKVGGPVTLRLAVRHRGRELAATKTHQMRVLDNPAPAPLTTPEAHPTPETHPTPERREWTPEYCPEPQLPSDIPASDGWIVGGLYLSGGPAPGIFACQSGPYTITVTNAMGATVATQQVVGRQSYIFTLPPGSYTLKSENGCGAPGSAVVIAGAQTKANIICNIP
jgi:hypothetical protein